jgi:hypothetical protein
VSENGEEDIIELSGKSDFLAFYCFFLGQVGAFLKRKGPQDLV